MGINECRFLDCDNWDNGTYICEGWNIIRRLYAHSENSDDYPKEDMMLAINSSMPKEEQIPAGLIRSALLSKVKTTDLQIGESVYIRDFSGKWEVFKIIGFGEDDWLNGHNVKGIPYFDKYRQGKENINNYVLDEYAYSADQ